MGRPRDRTEHDDVTDRFEFHPATPTTGPKHDEVRRRFRVLALWVLDDVPAGPERQQALLALQSAMMWANAGIAVRSEPEPLRGRRDEA